MFLLIEININTDIIHHIISEIIQLDTISQIFHHFTISIHSAITQAQINHPIIEFVVDIGALKNVATFIHNAAQSKVSNIIAIN